MKWQHRLQNYSLITLATVMIWLYAEGKNVSEKSVEFMVRLPSQIGQSTVIDPDGESDRLAVKVRVRGNSANISDLKSRLGAVSLLELPIEQADLPQESPGNINLMSLLKRVRISDLSNTSTTFDEMGISLIEVEPGFVKVHVDQLVEKEVDIVFRPEVVQIVPGSKKIDPPKIKVTLPKKLLTLLEASPDALKIEAVVPEEDLKKIPPGISQPVTANLQKPPVMAESKHVKLEADSVTVTFTIASQTESHTIQVVPVWVQAPPSEMRRYDVTLAEDSRVLDEVKITGPRKLIEQLKAEDSKLRVIARFELTANDLDKGIKSAPITMIEIQQNENGRTKVLEVVPLNPESLISAANPTLPTFLSENISITTADKPVVNFTITPRGE